MYTTGKEKGSPGRPADADPTAPDSESVIVAMERVSVLFDRYICLFLKKLNAKGIFPEGTVFLLYILPQDS